MDTLQNQLTSAEETLSHLEQERKDNMARLRVKLETAQENGVTGDALQGFKDRLADYDGLTNQLITTARATVNNLKEQIAGEERETQKRARAALDALKAKALQAWKENGGDEKGFNEAWPQMEQERLKQKTLEALSKETKSL